MPISGSGTGVVLGTDGKELQVLKLSEEGRIEVDEFRALLSNLNDTMERVQKQLSFITGTDLNPGEG